MKYAKAILVSIALAVLLDILIRVMIPGPVEFMEYFTVALMFIVPLIATIWVWRRRDRTKS
jgi:hypothetical protein